MIETQHQSKISVLQQKHRRQVLELEGQFKREVAFVLEELKGLLT